ncbi:hypothetical protein CTA2_9582, partial [Colletotrichum tanaceti]
MRPSLAHGLQLLAVCLALIGLLVGYDLFSGKAYLGAAYKPFRPVHLTNPHRNASHVIHIPTSTVIHRPTRTPTPTPNPTLTPTPIRPPAGDGFGTASTLPDGDPEHLKNAPKYITAI